MRVVRRAGPPGVVLLVLALPACGLAPTPGADGANAGPPEPLPPPGYGTLSERDVSVTLTSGELRVVVTPLQESMIVAAAPDTYRRLSALAGVGDVRRAQPFLVSFHSERADARFVPEEVQLMSGGVRARPATIDPLTPGWGEGRVRPRGTESAVYTFDRPVGLESDMVVLYGLDRSDEWSLVLPRIQAERRRAWARAGGGVDDARGLLLRQEPSSSYFEILR